MGRISSHKKYLKNLKERREGDLDYIRQARRGGMKFLGEQSEILAKQTESLARRRDLTPAAFGNIMNDQQSTFMDTAGKLELETLGQEKGVRDKYAGEIMKTEHEIDLEKANKKSQEKSLKGNMFSMGAKALGAAAGFIPGIGQIAQTAISSAVPAITDLAIGLDQSYEPEVRQQMIGSALNETLGGISALATLKTEKKFADDFGNAYGLLEGLEGEDRVNALEDLKLNLSMGNFDKFMEMYAPQREAI